MRHATYFLGRIGQGFFSLWLLCALPTPGLADRAQASPQGKDGKAAKDKPAVAKLDETLMLGGVPRDTLRKGDGFSAARSAIDAEFKPTAEQIAGDSKPVAVVKQLTRGASMQGGPPTLPAAATAPTGELDPVEQADAARHVYEQPASTRAVEILTTFEADGHLAAIEVIMPSGKSTFDDAAVAAVRRALRERPVVEPGSRLSTRMVARWRMSAGRAVTLPRVVPLADPPRANMRMPTRGLIGTGTMQFDETSGRVGGEAPFSNRLSSQVELLSVSPAPPPPATP